MIKIREKANFCIKHHQVIIDEQLQTNQITVLVIMEVSLPIIQNHTQ